MIQPPPASKTRTSAQRSLPPSAPGGHCCLAAHAMCIGAQFRSSSHLRRSQRYRVLVVSRHGVEPNPLVTLRPRGELPMTFERRS